MTPMKILSCARRQRQSSWCTHHLGDRLVATAEPHPRRDRPFAALADAFSVAVRRLPGCAAAARGNVPGRGTGTGRDLGAVLAVAHSGR